MVNEETATTTSDVQQVLDALDDPECRTILKTLAEPKTAQELMKHCGLSQTSTYRKLDLLSEAGLVEETTTIREDGHHETQYRRAFEGIMMKLTHDDTFDITLVETTESNAERLARFWSEVSEGL